MRGLATSLVLILIMIISHRKDDLLYSLSISSNWFMKLTMGMFLNGGNLLITKYDFALVGSLKSDINKKFNRRSDTFTKGSNWCPHGRIDIFD